ncbi:uncharacterized protein Tco025E_03394, partial [Trypanosoma conorhini]
ETPEPVHAETQEPVHAETPEPVHAETQEPVHAETQEPVHAETQKPVHAETQEPVHAETQEPVHAETQEPVHAETQERHLSSVVSDLYTHQYGNEVRTGGPFSAVWMAWMYPRVVVAGIVCAVFVTVVWVLLLRRSSFSPRGAGALSIMRWQLTRDDLLWEAVDARFALLLGVLSSSFDVSHAQRLCLRSVAEAYFGSCELHYVDLGNSISMWEDLEGQLRGADAHFSRRIRELKWSLQLREVALLEGQERVDLCLEERRRASQLWGHILEVFAGQLAHFMACEQARAAAAVDATPHADAEGDAAASQEDDNSNDTEDAGVAPSSRASSPPPATPANDPHAANTLQLEEMLRDMLLKENQEKHVLLLALQLLRGRLAERANGKFDTPPLSTNVTEGNQHDGSGHRSSLRRSPLQRDIQNRGTRYYGSHSHDAVTACEDEPRTGVGLAPSSLPSRASSFGQRPTQSASVSCASSPHVDVVVDGAIDIEAGLKRHEEASAPSPEHRTTHFGVATGNVSEAVPAQMRSPMCNMLPVSPLPFSQSDASAENVSTLRLGGVSRMNTKLGKEAVHAKGNCSTESPVKPATMRRGLHATRLYRGNDWSDLGAQE